MTLSYIDHFSAWEERLESGDRAARWHSTPWKRNTYNLEFDRLALELNGANLKVDTNSGDIALGVGVVCKPQKQATLQKTNAIVSHRGPVAVRTTARGITNLADT